ncbi:winged helix-turn-helix transcriptional regulator [Flindersiella endophytica]
MLGRTYERENCSAARALEVVGERWSLLIIRNAMFGGQTRFTEFQRDLGVAPNILTDRLGKFVEAGIMAARQLGRGNENCEYVLTSKGLDLQPAILALTAWGDRWSAPQGPPVTYQHDGCGGSVQLYPRCERCNAALAPTQVTPRPGPGALPNQFN